MTSHRSAHYTLLAAAFVLVTANAAFASNKVHLKLITHAAFFSHEMKLTSPIDPQVFVKDAASMAAEGPQKILHAAGIRPARITTDMKSDPLYDAQGMPLGFTLGRWLGASGTVTITPAAKTFKLSGKFEGLIPNGRYSLFENHFDQKPIGFTPLDGAGTSNNFVAGKDGNATISMRIPTMPTAANGVLLVYHSDGQFHGPVRGMIGIDAHHQLIARP